MVLKADRLKGIQVFRPFVFGSIATPLPIDPSKRPPNISPDHTHQWTVYVRGVDGADITYWLKKVQFKLHETYAAALRTIDSPGPYEVTETGWGEFEISIKLFFVPEAGEKPASVYHQLKLHPYGEDAEGKKERRESVISQSYEEILFSEPSEAFYEVLTMAGPTTGTPGTPGAGSGGRGGGKAGKIAAARQKSITGTKDGRSADIPATSSPTNPYSQHAERNELDRLNEAIKKVEQLAKEERTKLAEREKALEDLRKSEGLEVGKKK